jgi:3-oxoacyl-[acyl-carrier protein] reductase
MSDSPRRALVTAASSGIGYGVSERLAQAGHQVYITGVEEDLVPAAAESLGAAGYRVCDFSMPGTAAAAATSAIEAMGGVDILVSNTGGPPPSTFLALSEEDWERSYRLILDSAIQLTRTVLPGMVDQRWGRLIYLTSSGVIQPMPQLHLSNVMRSGVKGLADSLVAEVGPLGVTAHVIAPAHIDTARRRQIGERRAAEAGVSAEEIEERDRRTIPVGRFGLPADIAALVAFLAGEEAGFLTGQTLAVDGGFLHLGAL